MLLPAMLRVLGEVELDGGTQAGAPKERALLAVLATAPNESVGEGRIVEALWGDDQPAMPEGALRAHVSRLRRAVGEAGATIERVPSGYRLRIDADEIDAVRAERLLASGRAAVAAGDLAGASVDLAAALALWRGDPLG